MRMRSVAIEKHKAAKTSTKSTATRSSTPSKLALIDNVLKETADHCFILRCCHGILSFSATFGNSVDRVVGKTDSQESSPNRVPANECRSRAEGPLAAAYPQTPFGAFFSAPYAGIRHAYKIRMASPCLPTKEEASLLVASEATHLHRERRPKSKLTARQICGNDVISATPSIG